MMFSLRLLLVKEESIRKLSLEFDEVNFLETGSGLSLFRHLVARKIIEIDLSLKIDLDSYLEFSVDENAFEKELVVI